MTESIDAKKQELLRLLGVRSVKIGTFTLTSGKTSDFYVDCKQTAFHAKGASLIGELVFDHISNLRSQGMRILAVGGMTLGADPIAVATAMASSKDQNPVDAFVIRKEPKAHGTHRYVEGMEHLPEQCPVLLVEDVVTTGGSTLRALDRAKQSGLNPVAILALVDREEGGTEVLEKTGLPFCALLKKRDFMES